MTETIASRVPRPLNDVLAYRNERVINSFTDKLDVSRDEAERIFLETLRWLWYVATTTPSKENPEAHGMDSPMFIIDEMWHVFILVTRDYAAFCDEMFGRFIHHDPGSAGAVAYGANYAVADGADYVERTLEQTTTRKRAKYTDIYERLGEAVFLTWYREFPQAYPISAIRRLRKR
jgi:hypothetical protein